MKDQRLLIDTFVPATGVVTNSDEAYQQFSAKLTSGSAATVVVEASANGSTGWTTVCTFTLDTVGQLISTDMLRIDARYVRARVSALSGPSPRVFAWIGS